MARTWTMMATVASGVLLAGQAMAQTSPPKTPLGQIPDHTTATFSDWTLRCDRRLDLTPPQRICELGLVIQKPGEAGAQAQMAIGRIALGQPLRITAVLPSNVALKTAPRIVIEGQLQLPTALSWTRCIAGACFADSEISPDLLNALRTRTEPVRLDYRDATDREVTQSVSLRGLRPALEALALEEGR